ncbi:hypothetical protein MAR_034539 [Mya arenaria]|uniref:Uncharacterized protein n=1 Tax=Mya arenaria TaxID=6604 RepID=A0ABY7GDK8_MYAAR|nr:hypothetical protein MAR_034539 [Mya arenaria]
MNPSSVIYIMNPSSVTVYEKTVPPPFDVGYSRQPLPIPPPQRLPPLPPPQTEVYYQKPRSLDVALPVAAPEVVYNDAPRREQDVIYLKR